MLFIYSVKMVSRTEKNIVMEKNVHSLDTWKINSHENLRRKKFLGKFEKKYMKKNVEKIWERIWGKKTCKFKNNISQENKKNMKTKLEKIWEKTFFM